MKVAMAIPGLDVKQATDRAREYEEFRRGRPRYKPSRSQSGSNVDPGSGVCLAPLERPPLVLAQTAPHASILP